MLEKLPLRRQLLAQRQALSLTQWQSRSSAIVARVQAHCESMTLKTVALYAPIAARREVDVSALDAWFRTRNVAVAYPIMTASVRGFTLVEPSTMSSVGGFPQPLATSVLLRPGDLDLIVAPALGVTTAGYRLGYGAGFYDEQLRKFCPPALSICVVFTEQVVDELPLESHDEPCVLVLTDHA